MKTLIFLSFLFPTVILAQYPNTTERSGAKNIYNDAIKRYINHGRQPEKSSIDTLFILKDDFLRDSFAIKVGKTIIQIMDGPSIQGKVERDTSFILHKFFPLGFDKGSFYIAVVPFVTHEDDGELIMENTGTCKIFYSYQSKQRRFTFLKVDWQGF